MKSIEKLHQQLCFLASRAQAALDAVESEDYSEADDALDWIDPEGIGEMLDTAYLELHRKLAEKEGSS